MVFSYEQNNSFHEYYQQGKTYQSKHRLNTVKSLADNQTVFNYKINYEQIENSQASRVSEIQQCAGDGQCYNPSKFNYNLNDNLWKQASLSQPYPLQDNQGRALGVTLDINNDGFNDWVIAYKSTNGEIVKKTWLGSKAGFSSSAAYALNQVLFDYSLNEEGVPRAQLADIDGDGLVDLVSSYRENQTVYGQVYYNTGRSFTSQVANKISSLPIELINLDSELPTGIARLVDINGDNLVDVIASTKLSNGSEIRKTWINKITHWQDSSNFYMPTYLLDYTSNDHGVAGSDLVDINSDGLLDVILALKNSSGQQSLSTWLNTGTGFVQNNAYSLPVALTDYSILDKGTPFAELTDINGDGLLDIIQAINLPNNQVIRKAWLNSGLSFLSSSKYEPLNATFIVNDENIIKQYGVFQDLDGDGIQEQIISYINTSGNKITVVNKLTGNKYAVNDSLISKLPSLAYFKQYAEHTSTILQSADLNGDGRAELFYSSSDSSIGGQIETPAINYNSSGDYLPSGYLKEHVNGLGIATRLFYGLTTDNVIYQSVNERTEYPIVNNNSPQILIKSIKKMDGLIHPSEAYSNEQKGWYSINHYYEGLKHDISGRGSLGFSKKSNLDQRTGLSVVASYYQTYPYTGQAKKIEKYLNNKLLSKTETNLRTRQLNGGKTIYPFTYQTLSINYSEENDSIINQAKSEFEYDSFGNTTKKEIIAKDRTETSQATTLTEYGNNVSGENWILGMAVKTEILSNVNGQSARNFTTAVYNDKGQVIQEVLEPGNENQVQTNYRYDTFGNVIESSITADNGFGQKITRQSKSEFDNFGRFPISAENALGHKSHAIFDERFGKLISQTDPNGIKKEIKLDSFSTVLREDIIYENKTQAKEVVLAKWCDQACRAGALSHAAYFVAALDDQGESPQTVYFDAYGREILKKTIGASLTKVGDENASAPDIYIHTQYDELGRKIAESTPGKNMSTLLYNTQIYDVFDRVKQSTSVDGAVTNFQYNGSTTNTINAKNQTAYVTNNIQGKPILSVDAQGNRITYRYDARGNLTHTTDSDGNVISLKYDIFSRKIAMDDPDMGAWTYRYDGFGNLIHQTDAKGQAVTMEYDALNRLVKRIEPEGETIWNYDSAKLGDTDIDALGLLASINAPHDNYQRYHFYDSFARSERERIINQGTTYENKRRYFRSTDKVAWQQYPSGLTMSKEYDSSGFPMKLSSVDITKYNQYLDAQNHYEDLVNEAIDFQNKHKDELNEYAEKLYGEKTGEDEEGEPEFAGNGLNDQVKPYNDNLLAFQNASIHWSSDASTAGDLLNQHYDWYKAYSKEFIDVWQTPYNSMIARANGKVKESEPYVRKADEEQRLGDEDYNRAKPYIKNLEQAQKEADISYRQAREAFKNACYNGGYELHTGKLGSLGVDCAFGPSTGDGRLSDFGLKNTFKTWCSNPKNGPVSQCESKYHVQAYSWLPSLNSNLSALETYMRNVEIHLEHYSKKMDEANSEYKKAEPWINRSKEHYKNANNYANKINNLINEANSISKQATDRYGEGMNDYGNLVNNHATLINLLSNENMTGRYDRYIQNLEHYVGTWKCVNEDDYTPPNNPTGEIIEDDTLGKIIVNESKKEVYQINEAAEKDDCENGQLKVLVKKGEIQKEQDRLNQTRLSYRQNYYYYKYKQLSENINSYAEKATKYYDDVVKQREQEYKSSESVYWQALDYETDGQIKTAEYGNGVITSYQYEVRGRVAQIYAGKNSETIQSQWYSYDQIGNLNRRHDSINDITETFNYDSLNRLTKSNLSGQGAAKYQQAGLQSQTFEYDALGNITYKSDVGNYNYASDKPHALTSTEGVVNTNFRYDANGNQISGHGRDLVYSSYNKPVLIEKNGDKNEFKYGPERQLIYQKEINGEETKITKYIGGVYEEQILNGLTKAIHNISIAGHQIAVLKTTVDLSQVYSEHYLHQDHLESVVMITDDQGDVVSRYHYDSFGKQRAAVVEPKNLSYPLIDPGSLEYLVAQKKADMPMIQAAANTAKQYALSTAQILGSTLSDILIPSANASTSSAQDASTSSAQDASTSSAQDASTSSAQDSGSLSSSKGQKNSITDKGYTGYRQLNATELIHMKGRVYDPTFGRFLSADPHIQSPLNSQSLNRYSYVLNNPLSLNDPSGYFFSFLKKLFKKIIKAIKRIVKLVVDIIKKVTELQYRYIKYHVGKLKENWRVVAAIAIAVVAPYAVAAVAMGGFAAGAAAIAGSGIIGAIGVGGAITAGAIAGGLGGLITTGSFKGILTGALTGAAFAGVGAKFAQLGKSAGFLTKAVDGGFKLNAAGVGLQITSHGVVGGLSGKLSGGSFSKGFFVSAVTKMVNLGAATIDALNNTAGIIAIGAVAGGTASLLVGGSFAQGAAIGALAAAMNQALSRTAKNISARSLTADEKKFYGKYFKTNVLDEARIHEGDMPPWVRGDAKAVTLENNIYTRGPLYKSGSPEDMVNGTTLLGHELAHVDQFLNDGMSYTNYIWESRYGYDNNVYEKWAFKLEEHIQQDYCIQNNYVCTNE